jgi:hypothetical protein
MKHGNGKHLKSPLSVATFEKVISTIKIIYCNIRGKIQIPTLELLFCNT